MKQWHLLWSLNIGLIGLLGTSEPMLAREKPDFTTLLGTIYSQQVEEISYETLFENLWRFYQHPIALNQTSREDLASLCILTDTQLDCFFEHLERNGALVSIYELQAIPRFDLTTIYQLVPFVQVSETYPKYTTELMRLGGTSKKHGYCLSQYGRTLADKQGYQPNEKTGCIPYAGSPDKIATCFKYMHPQGFSLGISGRKYAGEDFTWDPATARYGLDVWSAYFMLKNRRLIETCILGDYRVGYGQGLVVNTGFSMDKSAETIPIMRTNNLGIKPHTSSTRYGFRGIACTLAWKQLKLATYYANTKLDARVMDDAAGQAYVTRVQRDGFHRTRREIAKKGQVNEQVIGGTLIGRTKANHAEFGMNALHTHYAIPIRPNPRRGSIHNFSGQHNVNLGLFYRYLWQNLHFFGEGAICANGGKAVLIGCVASLSAKADASLLFRHYDQDFHSPYGNAFRENSSGNNNERGAYVGLKLQPIKKLNFHTYYDYFTFPAPTATIAVPSSGYDWLAKITYQLERPSLFLFQYKEVSKFSNIPKSKRSALKGATPPAAAGRKRKYKAQLKHTLSNKIDLHSEIQGSSYTLLDDATWGYALMQSTNYRKRRLNITGQVAWFDTDYANRLFFYEKDVWYSGLMPTFYHKKGMKYCVYACFKPTLSWHLAIKYTFTWYIGESSIGQGDEKIKGNTKKEVKLQIIYRF